MTSREVVRGRIALNNEIKVTPMIGTLGAAATVGVLLVLITTFMAIIVSSP